MVKITNRLDLSGQGKVAIGRHQCLWGGTLCIPRHVPMLRGLFLQDHNSSTSMHCWLVTPPMVHFLVHPQSCHRVHTPHYPDWWHQCRRCRRLCSKWSCATSNGVHILVVAHVIVLLRVPITQIGAIFQVSSSQFGNHLIIETPTRLSTEHQQFSKWQRCYS